MKVPLARTIEGLVAEMATRDPGAIAVMTGDATLTFGALDRSADAVAARLREEGAQRGDVIGVLGPNTFQWLEIAVGSMRAGCSVAAFNTWARRWDLEQMFPYVQMHTLFAVGEYRNFDFVSVSTDVLNESQVFEAPSTSVVQIGEGDLRASSPATPLFDDWLGADTPRLPDLAPGERPSAVDPAFILFTSGSTSAPKAVPLCHYGAIENGFNIGERQGIRSTDRVWVPVPLFWSYGCANALMAAWTHGAAVVINERFEPGIALDTIESTNSTHAYLLPNITQSLLQHPSFSADQTASLRSGLTIGTPQDIELVAKELAVPGICNVYGSTEVYGNCCVTPHDWDLSRRMESQGPPLPGVEIRVVDPSTGDALPREDQGEIQVRGYVTPGYLTGPGEPTETPITDDGFFITGDFGILGEDGVLTYAGRASEMIKTGGINVSPLEVEEFLRTHRSVSSAAVVGVPDETKGELVIGFVVPVSDGAVSGDELVEHCQGVMASYKIPQHIFVVDELPTTDTNKLSRRELRAWAHELLDPTDGEGSS